MRTQWIPGFSFPSPLEPGYEAIETPPPYNQIPPLDYVQQILPRNYSPYRAVGNSHDHISHAHKV
jgi:hypothetical protein